ncbi:Ca2+-binding protein, RTX toxin-related [Palleronia marisminoris]|uniref:Bifunctional hemolysin/adenylate cyclase n=1 Tax=Palleronia marisminoris TaxID=315423 RepID=A0A1Y5SVK3_9RHOB|nr:peroxidase family protein [Palleronia marisminoris]SFG94085.1 Ca2+-binding protein, RTX toxin-related [Palleronia marisminoris]SLN46062.1 Bifunctional hemolysin/adenylate cyclase precursor [Palleronia marisminoris]
MAVKLNQHDLQFILDQIKIAEAHVAGTPLEQLIAQPHLPYGLRTVDGSFNNITPGRELWGAADQIMPRAMQPHYMNEGDDSYHGPFNNDYGVVGQPTNGMGQNGGHTGNVVDADPRIISNLVSDQTLNNPAAIAAALQYAEYEGDLSAGVTAVRALYANYLNDPAVADLQVLGSQVNAAKAALAGAKGVLRQAQQSGDPVAIQTAQAAVVAAEGVLAATEATVAPLRDALQPALDAAKEALDEELLTSFDIEMDGNTIMLPNVAPDEGLSAPFNGWMTFFGQFFDHGLDLIHKGDNGTIYMPLSPDDPLVTHGPDGIPNSGDEVDVNMPLVLTRLAPSAGPGADGILGTADDTAEARNKTTPFVDQNQTYTSHPSHQVFLRQYEMVDGKPMATGRLLDGVNGGLATWADVKQQAREMLGINLDDRDVFGVPLMLTDPYGEFIRDENGYPQVVTNIGPDLIPNTADDVTISGTAENPIVLAELNGGRGPVRTSHAFLDDIAHNAVPVLVAGAAGQPAILMPDPNSGTDPVGDPIPVDPDTGATLYDNELLDQHFIVGDGRGNENIGLTAVHHVFHSEHNRQLEANKKYILELAGNGDIDFLNEWLLEPVEAGFDAATLNWDGERLFQTARFATEMQYQHLVFEEFGRKVSPLIDVFVFNSTTDVDPSIYAEFAHTVYRFGHSMLTDHLKLLPLNEEGVPVDAEGNPVAIADWGVDVGLIEAFLNPVLFDHDGTITADQAAGAIFRGMTYVRGNAIDEFVTESLRNNLLGLPLDLPAINLARGRDAGVPSLNDAREQLYAASNSTWLKPYESWADFGANLKTPASVINFIAAYGAHDSIAGKVDNGVGGLRDRTLAEKRDAATLLVLGGAGEPADRHDFLHSTGAWTAANSGLNTVDLWIGGLAEKIMPFGGMLGATFNAIFELQLENLQEGDRFYYLSRTQGLNLLNELENNAFTKLVMANTDMALPGADGILGTEDDEVNFHVGVDSFAKHDVVLEVDVTKQIALDPEGDDPVLNAIRAKVQRDDPSTPGADTNYLRFTGGEHAVMGGTEGNDTIIGGDGDDAIWGDTGDDRIEGGHGVDLIIGGAGDDIITDMGDTGDFIKGESGDDVIANSNGLDIIMGGDGKDVILVGVDATEVFAGEGDDFILGGADHDFLMGNEGDDWIEGGDGFDVISGDNSELFFNSTIIGHDVMFAGANENDFDAESGDDIMVQGESVMRNEGMFGFDWAIHKGSAVAADSDMAIPIFTTAEDKILRDRFDQVEGLSGWHHNDVLRGDDRGSNEEVEAEFNLSNHGLSQAGVNRIDGLRELLGISIEDAPTGADVDLEEVIAWAEGNILLGGDGNDTFEGRGADDFIHGDAWLNVRIRLVGVGDENTPENELATVDTLKHVFTQAEADALGLPGGSAGKALSALLLSGAIKPNQMHIVREIKYAEDASDDTDTAIFSGNRDWYEITHVGDRTYVSRRESENIDPQVDEGTDTLIGIERIQFSDGIYTIRETGNVDPTGRLMIEGLPAREDEPLTVNLDNIRDLNNPDGRIDPTTVTIRWQIERNDGSGDYIDIPNVSGPTFTPSDEHDGLRVRVLGTYYDAGGVFETVSSQPTDPVVGVNDEPTGPLLISDMSPTEGQELTATVAFTDPDGMADAFEEGLLTYQWQHSADGLNGWTDVPAADGGNGRSFVPGSQLVEQHLRVVVVYFDDLLNEHTVISDVTEVVGNFIESNAPLIDVDNGDDDAGTTVGDDMIIAGSGDNVIDAGEGNDVINGGAGNDQLIGNVGDDTLDGGAGDDIVNGGLGNDTITYANGQGADTINGQEGNDRLKIVEGMFDGNDQVEVTLAGGNITRVNQTTTVTGVEANELHLGGGTDTLTYDTSEGVSVNLLTGAATGFSVTRGVENVTGGTGNDTLLGNSLDNVFDGREGDDALHGGFGNDALQGGEGDDDLRGDAGNDILEGGAGDDRIDGGAGIDTASYASAGAAVTVSLLGQAGRASFEEQDTLGAGIDRLIGIENLEGSAFADTLTGNAGANVIDGGTGADTMTGGLGDDTYVMDTVADVIIEAADGGNDTVQTSISMNMATQFAAGIENIVLTGTGNISGRGQGLDNRLTGNAGNNTLNGAAGVDTLVLDGAIADYTFIEPGAGPNTFEVSSAAGGTDRIINIERIEVGGQSYNIVRGNNAGNTLAGTANGDLMLGLLGDDVLNGGGGDDILVGGAGNDQMSGGEGNDTYLVTEAGDRVNEVGGNGVDTILSEITLDLNSNRGLHVAGDVEHLTLIGTGNIDGTGNNGDNIVTGNSGQNHLVGGAGNDTLFGNDGDDRLSGYSGDDVLDGGAGNDILNGGVGIDTAVFAGKAGDYAFEANASGIATMTHLESGDVDKLFNIERLRFGDGEVLDIVTNGGGGVAPSGPSLILGTAAGETITGSNGNDVIIGGAGDDTLQGHDLADGELQLDDDTFIWRPGDGMDNINGGGEGVDGDLFQIIGNGEAETYRIYTYDEAVARIAYAGSDENEIVVTRQVAGQPETVIAELTEIEEIVVNGGGVSGGGQFGGDTVQMYGSFDVATSLRPNTITILGSSGNDTVDISSLLSEHRIVFKGAGGNDTIVGTLRPQDVVQLKAGKTIEDYTTTTNEDGSTTISTEGHSVTFRSLSGLPSFQPETNESTGSEGTDGQQAPAEDQASENDQAQGGSSSGDDTEEVSSNHDDDEDEDEDDDYASTPSSSTGVGTAQADVLTGTEGNDTLVGLTGNDAALGGGGDDAISGGDGNDFLTGDAGRDVIFGGSGNDDILGGDGGDMLYGDGGNDRLLAGSGDDLISGGKGSDVVFGGSGDDTILAEAGDGNDTYYGDDMDGGSGSDTLDMAAITANITADLGTGAGGRGKVVSSETGTDTLHGVENIVTGAGDDHITASRAVNVMDGGDGDDIFRFMSAEDADGDTIAGFQPGDRIDLSWIDADSGTSGNQSFTLVSGGFTGAGQLMVSEEVREDGTYTVLRGSTDDDDEADFEIGIKGSHQLSEAQLGF